MAKPYNCSSCGQTAQLELFDKNCPNCGADRDKMVFVKDYTSGFQNLIGGMTEFVKNKKNRPILIMAALILGFLLFQLCRNEPTTLPQQNLSLRLAPTASGNGVEFIFTLEKSTKKGIKEAKHFTKAVRKVLVNNEELSLAELEDNNFIYYPCKEGTLSFVLEAKGGKTINSLPIYTEVKSLSFSKADKMAICNPLNEYPKPTIEENQCVLMFAWQGNKSNLRVSWNGVDGSYSKSMSKKSSALDNTFDVWYYAVGFENEKQSFLGNGTIVPQCIVGLTDTEIRAKFLDAFKQLGKSPNASNSADLTPEIKGMCSASILLTLDGQKESSINGLFQAMKNQADEAEVENSKIWFECVESSIKIANGKVISFDVIIIKAS